VAASEIWAMLAILRVPLLVFPTPAADEWPVCATKHRPAPPDRKATHDEPIDQWREPPSDARCRHVPSLLSLSVLYAERELTSSRLPLTGSLS
jgi:hypothetical protein